MSSNTNVVVSGLAAAVISAGLVLLSTSGLGPANDTVWAHPVYVVPLLCSWAAFAVALLAARYVRRTVGAPDALKVRVVDSVGACAGAVGGCTLLVAILGASAVVWLMLNAQVR